MTPCSPQRLARPQPRLFLSCWQVLSYPASCLCHCLWQLRSARTAHLDIARRQSAFGTLVPVGRVPGTNSPWQRGLASTCLKVFTQLPPSPAVCHVAFVVDSMISFNLAPCSLQTFVDASRYGDPSTSHGFRSAVRLRKRQDMIATCALMSSAGSSSSVRQNLVSSAVSRKTHSHVESGLTG